LTFRHDKSSSNKDVCRVEKKKLEKPIKSLFKRIHVKSCDVFFFFPRSMGKEKRSDMKTMRDLTSETDAEFSDQDSLEHETQSSANEAEQEEEISFMEEEGDSQKDVPFNLMNGFSSALKNILTTSLPPNESHFPILAKAKAIEKELEESHLEEKARRI